VVLYTLSVPIRSCKICASRYHVDLTWQLSDLEKRITVKRFSNNIYTLACVDFALCNCVSCKVFECKHRLMP
jgi:hypothetical protein